MKKLLFFVVVIFAALQWFSEPGRVDYGPGVLVAEQPLQTAVSGEVLLNLPGYDVAPLARFQIRARVLSIEKYQHDRGAVISPVDFALGWGNMSDQTVIDQIEISQSGRWYRWQTDTLPIPLSEIAHHSANMHIIPKDEFVKRQLSKARVGDVINIDGYLVEVKQPDGWSWKSSLTRRDTGARACELIWVDRFSIVNI